MPETPFTAYCEHMYHLNQRLHDFVVQAVVPAIDAELRARQGTSRKRENAIQISFTRVIRWLMTVDKLDKTHYVQAIGAAARGVFEIYVDLKWMEKFPESEWLEKFCAYPDVSMYVAAKTLVEWKSENPSSSLDSGPQDAFIKRIDANPLGRMNARVSALWGTKGNGDPRWPTGHWTNDGDLRTRARKISLDLEGAYVQIYPTLCALVHPGPSPEVRETLSDFVWLEKQMGFGYCYMFVHARAAMITTCDLLGIRQHIEGFDHAMQRLNEWLEKARTSLPNP
jgi:hypothetical protein